MKEDEGKQKLKTEMGKWHTGSWVSGAAVFSEPLFYLILTVTSKREAVEREEEEEEEERKSKPL